MHPESESVRLSKLQAEKYCDLFSGSLQVLHVASKKQLRWCNKEENDPDNPAKHYAETYRILLVVFESGFSKTAQRSEFNFWGTILI